MWRREICCRLIPCCFASVAAMRCVGITNLASATTAQTQVVLKHGAVPVLVKLLKSQDPDVREQGQRKADSTALTDNSHSPTSFH